MHADRHRSEQPIAPSDLRAHPRTEVMRRGVVVDQAGASFTCAIVDVSLGGARLQLFASDLPGGDLTLIDTAMGTVHELRVAWRNGDFVGVAFTATVALP
jgi:hypothetical protein